MNALAQIPSLLLCYYWPKMYESDLFLYIHEIPQLKAKFVYVSHALPVGGWMVP